MEIIAGTTNFILEKETAVAIGKFDGVHIGHRRLLDEILAKKEKGLAACVFTFDPPPAVLFGQSDYHVLSTREEKRILFERMGIDILIEFPLTLETAAILPERFVADVLARQMNARFVAAGEDLSFGYQGAGNTALLESMGPMYGFVVRTIEKIRVGDVEVGSTYIRKLVEEGRMEEACQMLGTPYPFTGLVEHGRHLGHSLGFPTVNLLPPPEKLAPPCGVYDSLVMVRGKVYHGLTNVGYKPTVSKERILGVETYLYDFDEELYGEEVEVALKAFRRPEKKFASLEDLKSQLQRDIAGGRTRMIK